VQPHSTATSGAVAPASKAVIARPSMQIQVQPGAQTKSLSQAELREQMAKLERDLKKVDDDAQLANVDLQNALQKQQQTLQMMSNISKKLNDTAQAIARNLRG
jgi:hypothetical protein